MLSPCCVQAGFHPPDLLGLSLDDHLEIHQWNRRTVRIMVKTLAGQMGTVPVAFQLLLLGGGARVHCGGWICWFGYIGSYNVRLRLYIIMLSPRPIIP